MCLLSVIFIVGLYIYANSLIIGQSEIHKCSEYKIEVIEDNQQINKTSEIFKPLTYEDEAKALKSSNVRTVTNLSAAQNTKISADVADIIIGVIIIIVLAICVGIIVLIIKTKL